MKNTLLLLLIAFFSAPSWGWDLMFWRQESKAREYDFPSCAPYSNTSPTAGVDGAECALLENPSHLKGLEGDLSEIEIKLQEQALPGNVKEFVAQQLFIKMGVEQKLASCFGASVAPDEWCHNKRKTLRDEVRLAYPRMRLHMALKEPLRLPMVVGERVTFSLNPYLFHARDETKVAPISEAEIPLIRAQFDEETRTYEQEWFELHQGRGGIEKDSDGLWRLKEDAPSIHQRTLNNYVNITRVQKTKEHDALYRQILSEYPYFAFLTEADLPPGDQELDELIAKALGEQVEQMQREYGALRARTDTTFLLRYPEILESYLQARGADRPVCEGMQNLHDKYGEGGWLDLTTDLGLGLAALVGGGACIFTSGLACAALVAVGTEGIFLVRDQGKLADGLSLYHAGLASSESVDELESARNFSLALAPLSFIGLESGKGVARSFGRRHLERSLLRDTQHWLHYTATSTAQNRSWIRVARSNRAQLYFEVENSALKRLNDSYGDKNVVTALTNLHKHILFAEVDSLLGKFPGVKLERYSDFKSSRFAFTFPDGAPPVGLESELAQMMERVGARFDAEMVKINGLQLGSEVPHLWFTAGVGESADQAGLAGRQARTRGREGRVMNFRDVSEALSNTRANIESTREAIEHSLTNGGAQELLSTGPSGVKVPSLEVFELMRKNKGRGPYEVSELIKERFNIVLDERTASQLINYTSEIDQFSPGLWLPERVLANLDEAEYGGFSADFKGMGAKNLQQVAFDLSHRGDTLAASVERLRRGEEVVTKGFDGAKSSYRELISSELERMGIGVVNKCSGDDCVSLPAKTLTRLQEEEIVRKIAASGRPDNYRLSFIPPGIALKARSNLAVHGELVEKEIRATLTGHGVGKVAPEVMSDLTIAIRMPASLGSGKVELVLAAGKEGILTPELKSLIEGRLKSATSKVNRELASELGAEFHYQSAY